MPCSIPPHGSARAALSNRRTVPVLENIDPASATVQNNEVIAKGFVDQSVPRGAEIWRLVKSGTLSFSFGFLYDPTKGVEKLRGDLAECKKSKKKTPECTNTCGRVKALVEDGVPVAAFESLAKEHEETCAEKK